MKAKLLSALACPKCFGKLEYNEQQQKLICHQDQLIYRLIDGIPVLLENEAIANPLSEAKDNL